MSCLLVNQKQIQAVWIAYCFSISLFLLKLFNNIMIYFMITLLILYTCFSYCTDLKLYCNDLIWPFVKSVSLKISLFLDTVDQPIKTTQNDILFIYLTIDCTFLFITYRFKSRTSATLSRSFYIQTNANKMHNSECNQDAY